MVYVSRKSDCIGLVLCVLCNTVCGIVALIDAVFKVRILKGHGLTFQVYRMERGAQWSSCCLLGFLVRDPRFKPRPGQTFWSRFLFHVHPYSASGTKSEVNTRANPKQGTHIEWGRKGRANGCRYFWREEKKRNKSNDTSENRIEDWKTPRRGKRQWKRHWTPTGCVPMQGI